MNQYCVYTELAGIPKPFLANAVNLSSKHADNKLITADQKNHTVNNIVILMTIVEVMH